MSSLDNYYIPGDMISHCCDDPAHFFNSEPWSPYDIHNRGVCPKKNALFTGLDSILESSGDHNGKEYSEQQHSFQAMLNDCLCYPYTSQQIQFEDDMISPKYSIQIATLAPQAALSVMSSGITEGDCESEGTYNTDETLSIWVDTPLDGQLNVSPSNEEIFQFPPALVDYVEWSSEPRLSQYNSTDTASSLEEEDFIDTDMADSDRNTEIVYPQAPPNPRKKPKKQDLCKSGKVKNNRKRGGTRVTKQKKKLIRVCCNKEFTEKDYA